MVQEEGEEQKGSSLATGGLPICIIRVKLESEIPRWEMHVSGCALNKK